MNEMYLHTYYNPEWVLGEIKENNYFSIAELVSDAVLSKYGEAQCWSFLDPRLLANLLWIRVERGNGMIVNYNTSQQRGLRENTCPIVKGKTDKGSMYLSAHTRGMAVDYHENSGDTAEDIRQWIVAHADGLPYAVRLEWKMKGEYITWVHLDVAHVQGQNKVHLFNV